MGRSNMSRARKSARANLAEQRKVANGYAATALVTEPRPVTSSPGSDRVYFTAAPKPPQREYVSRTPSSKVFSTSHPRMEDPVATPGGWRFQLAMTEPTERPTPRVLKQVTQEQRLAAMVRVARKSVRIAGKGVDALFQVLIEGIELDNACMSALVETAYRASCAVELKLRPADFQRRIDALRLADRQEATFLWMREILDDIHAADASVERANEHVIHVKRWIADLKATGPKVAADARFWDVTSQEARVQRERVQRAAAPVKAGMITPITEDHPTSHLDPKFFTRGTD